MDKSVFTENRRKVFEQMDNNSVMVIFSRRGPDVTFQDRYEINRNYFYLTGVVEYGNILVMRKKDNKCLSTMFIHQFDELKAKWVGAPKTKEEITETSGVDEVCFLDSFDSSLMRYMESYECLYIDIITKNKDEEPDSNDRFASGIKERMPWVMVKNARPLLQHARTAKQPEELDQMRKAIEITNKGIENILRHMGPMYEYQLESYFDQAIKFNGATGYAFPTIAASGANACCLHYSENNSFAKDGDLILFDLGANYNCYCADISRTFPVNGKYSRRQKQLYDIVLAGQKMIFGKARPGVTTKDLNGYLREYYKVELKKIGLIEEGTEEEVSKYYFHGVSHHIGVDVHDLADYTPLKAGCVISNEPGLYISEEGIGIRIEDDVLITETGAEWLSPQIIKETDDIENFIRENKI